MSADGNRPATAPPDPQTAAAVILDHVRARRGPDVVVAARAVPTAMRPNVLTLLARAAARVPAGTPDSPAAGVALASAALESRVVEAAGHLVWLFAPEEDHPLLDPELWADAVVPRGRAWCTRLVRALLSGEDTNAAARWRWVDALVRRGVVDPPAHATDVLWVLRQPWAGLADRAAREPRVASHLERLLTTPGAGREIKHAPVLGGWPVLIGLLGADEAEGRARVLDEVLAGLLGALPETDSEGLALLLEALEPTDLELTSRQAAVLDLLLARRPTVAALARTWAGRIAAAGTLEGDALLAVTPDVLALERKNAVRAHLGLLETAVAGGSVSAAGAADVLIDCLDLTRPDVVVRVARTLGTFTRTLPDDDVEGLRARVAVTVPEPWAELRRALGPLTAAPCSPPAARPTTTLPAQDDPSSQAAHSPRPTPVPVDLPVPGRVEPVRDVDEMMDLAARLLSDASADPLDLERALDGVARLRGLPGGVTESFRGRGEAGLRSAPDPAVVSVLHAWAGLPYDRPHGMVLHGGNVRRREDAPPGAHLDGPYDVRLSPDLPPSWSWHWERWVDAWGPAQLARRRLGAACLMAEGPPAAALALPTRDDGTLDLDTFLGRTAARAAAGQPFWGDDVGTALLRLPAADRAELGGRELPEGTRSALDVLDRPEQWVRAAVTLRHGARSGADRELWVAQDPPVGAPEDPVRSWLDTRTVADGWTSSSFDGLVTGGDMRLSAGWALSLPGRPDLLAVHLQPALIGWVDDPAADLSSVVGALGRSRVPLGAPAAAALVWAASARSVTTRAAAAEAIAGAARTGMLSGAVLGTELASLVGPEAQVRPQAQTWPAVLPTVTRVATTLADAARIDEHGEVVTLDTVLACLDVLPAVRNGAALLEVAATLATRRRVRVQLPDRLAALARGSSRLAQEARRLAEAG